MDLQSIEKDTILVSDKIVLAYAKKYWNIGDTPKDGIGLVSKSFYESLSKIFPEKEIIYIDFSEYSQIRGVKGIERIFTISAHIDRFQAIAKTSEINLISVNEHALMRRRVRDYAKLNGIPASFLEPHDGIRSNLRETKGVSNVIAFGSWNTFKSYELAGFDPQKVFPIGWKYWNSQITQAIPGERNTILCYLGSICVRKGVYELEKLLEFLQKQHPHFILHLVGFVNNSKLNEWLLSLMNKFKSNFKWTNERIHYGENNWLQLRKGVAFAIFPSWEEGLSGCLMDTINLGIPTIYSDRAGLEYSHSFLSDFDFFSESWLDKIHSLIEGGQNYWDDIAIAQKKSAFFQYQNNNSIEKVLFRLKSGHLWPKVKVNIKDSTPREVEVLTADFDLDAIKPDFLLESTGKSQQNSIVLNFLARNSTNFSSIDRFRMAVIALERYTAYESLRFFISPSGPETFLSRAVSSFSFVESRAPIELSIPVYHQGHAISYLHRILFYQRQLTNDLFYFIFYYYPKRYLNIIRLKLIIESNNFFNRFSMLRKRNQLDE